MNPTPVRTAGSRWSSGPWQWATVTAVVAVVVCVVGWPWPTLCAVGVVLAVVALTVGIRRFVGEQRASAPDVSGQHAVDQAGHDRGDIQARVAEVLRAAAHDCDSLIDGDADATACRAQHPIQVGAWHHGVVSDVYGPVSAIADVVADVFAPELDELGRYRICVDWDTTCTEHARLLGQLRAAEETIARNDARIIQALAVAEVIDANGIGWAADRIRRALTPTLDAPKESGS